MWHFSRVFLNIWAELEAGHGLQRKDISNMNGIKLNTIEHTVEKKGKSIKLTVKEFAILELFLRNKNKVLTRDKIIAHVWDFSYDTFSNIVDVNIRNIRGKLQNKNENILETVYGVGYRFNA